MALQKVQLGLAERRVISGILSRSTREGVDVSTSRTIREIRIKLEVRRSDKLIDRVTEEAAEARVRTPDWDDLFDLAAWLSEANEELSEEERTPIELKKHEKELAGTVERTIDSHYLDWLKKALDKTEWHKVYVQRGQGQIEEVVVSVPIGQVEAIASTADALDAAQEVKEG